MQLSSNPNLFNFSCGYFIMTYRLYLFCSIFKLIWWILDGHHFKIRFCRIPDHIEPVSIFQLPCLEPFINSKPYRLTPPPSLSLYPFDPTIAGCRIRRTQAPNIKTQFVGRNIFWLPAPIAFISNNNLHSCLFTLLLFFLEFDKFRKPRQLPG